MPASDLSRDTLQHYAEEGLLQSRIYARPVDLQTYGFAPKAGDKYTWLVGTAEYDKNLHMSARNLPDVEVMPAREFNCYTVLKQKRLILTKAAYRTIRGMRERTVTSPFLNEMPAEAFEVEDRTGLPGASDRSEYRDRLSSESARLANQFRRGQMVRHPTFGIGRISEISDMGQHTRAVVEFNSAGRKTLILQYARLEAVG